MTTHSSQTPGKKLCSAGEPGLLPSPGCDAGSPAPCQGHVTAGRVGSWRVRPCCVVTLSPPAHDVRGDWTHPQLPLRLPYWGGVTGAEGKEQPTQNPTLSKRHLQK